MVRIEGIAVEVLQKNLKAKKVGKLAEKIFGKSVYVNCFPDALVISEQSTLKPRFLVILTDINSFSLQDKQYFRKTKGLTGKYEEYFSKTKELAKKYEELFGGEVTIGLKK